MSTHHVEKGSGNIFADLGITEPETALAKAELAFRINAQIEERALKQTEAAALLGIDQAKVSALKRGKLTGFPMERLFRFLTLLGSDVRIVVRKAPVTRKEGRIHVSAS